MKEIPSEAVAHEAQNRPQKGDEGSDEHFEELDMRGARSWLADFESARGRPLRVLHIGNIANNAYNNAKIQRARGIDADVLSFDYYHSMACPEWEDAEFSGDIGDPFFPDWWNVDLKGFRRPRWFAAGPLDAAVRYLLAATAKSSNASMLWRMLTFERWLLSRRSAWRDRLIALLEWLSGRRVTYLVTPANALVMRLIGRRLDAIGSFDGLKRTGVGRRLRWQGRKLLRFARTADISGDAARHLRLMRRNLDAVQSKSRRLFEEIGRTDHPDELEFFYQWWWHPYLSTLLSRYDVVQAYATYTALPYVAGHRRYVAYEHGTIRSIPFQETREGRMCMASYRAAEAVFVTNIDNISAAERMHISRDRVVALPHAFDSDKFVRFAEETDRRQPSPGDPAIFFTPTRQHWVDQDPGWAKGNDRVFAALRRLKDAGFVCRLRAVEWGQDVQASRARIAELGVGDMVEWVPSMQKRQLWRQYLDADAVIDQFLTASFSGVTFEAMMLGRRMITNDDSQRSFEYFGQAPPLFSCRTPEEIASAMRRVIEDPSDRAGAGAANKAWMEEYHSADRIVALQASVYRRMVDLPGHSAPAARM